MFTEKFSTYACPSESIKCETEGFEAIATIYFDDATTPPDERDGGFWPSLDPKSASYIGPKSKRTLARHTARARQILTAWQRDEWFYCGIAVVVSRNGVALTGQYDNALWGIECNYPGADNAYLQSVANELLGQALCDARDKLALLTT